MPDFHWGFDYAKRGIYFYGDKLNPRRSDYHLPDINSMVEAAVAVHEAMGRFGAKVNIGKTFNGKYYFVGNTAKEKSYMAKEAHKVLSRFGAKFSANKQTKDIFEDCSFLLKRTFISHNWGDEDLARTLCNDLYAKADPDATCWLDKNEMNDFDDMQTAIEQCYRFLLLLNHKYLGSANCKFELETAVKLKKSIVVVIDERHDRNKCLEKLGDVSPAAQRILQRHISRTFNREHFESSLNNIRETFVKIERH